jgi:hypothetical protein
VADAVWVKTEPTVDGSAYVVTIEASDDVAVTLDPDRALRYAWGVLDAAHRAAYDAAVFKQLTKLGIEVPAAAMVVDQLRSDRPPLDAEATKPLGFDPGVSQSTEEAFLAILIGGERVGQWNVEDARGHALAVLESVAVADLDGGYYRALIGSVGLDENRARQVVEDVGSHRG